MRYCTNCGKPVKDLAEFCLYCGHRVGSAAPAGNAAAADRSRAAANAAAADRSRAAANVAAADRSRAAANAAAANRSRAAANPAYANRGGAVAYAAPVGQLSTNRSLIKFILLSLITFGIYGIVVMSKISTDINTIASRYDGKRTMHYCLVFFIFSWLTLGIFPLVWSHKLCSRINGELMRRGIGYDFGTGTFWGWCFFGSLIIIGPFIYCHKLMTAMNKLCEHYNIYG